MDNRWSQKDRYLLQGNYKIVVDISKILFHGGWQMDFYHTRRLYRTYLLFLFESFLCIHQNDFSFFQRKTKIGVMISFITMWLFLHYSLYELFSQRCNSTCYVNWFFRHDFVSKDVNNMKWLWNTCWLFEVWNTRENIFWYDVWFIFVYLGFILP